MKGKHTVEQAVMDVIVERVAQGITAIPIHEIESAHPEHVLSGRARIRGLRSRGLVSYFYDVRSNRYLIESSLEQLEIARRALMRGENKQATAQGRRSGRRRAPECAPECAPDDRGLLEEMRNFLEGL